jgi:hypothetical protein
MKTTIQSIDQFNLTNATISQHTGLTVIGFPAIEHRSSSSALVYPIDTQIFATKFEGIDSGFRIKVCSRYMSKKSINASEGRIILEDREPTEAELKRIMA